MNQIDSYNKLLKELKDLKIAKLKEKYEQDLKLIENKTYKSLGELLQYNQYLLKDYPEYNEEFIKYYVESHTCYDDRYFYLNKNKISKDYFFYFIKEKDFEMKLDLQDYTEQIFVTLGNDKLEVYYYIGD